MIDAKSLASQLEAVRGHAELCLEKLNAFSPPNGVAELPPDERRKLLDLLDALEGDAQDITCGVDKLREVIDPEDE